MNDQAIDLLQIHLAEFPDHVRQCNAIDCDRLHEPFEMGRPSRRNQTMPGNLTVYPGNCGPMGMSLFAELIQYVDAFERITAYAASREGAAAQNSALFKPRIH